MPMLIQAIQQGYINKTARSKLSIQVFNELSVPEGLVLRDGKLVVPKGAKQFWGAHKKHAN